MIQFQEAKISLNLNLICIICLKELIVIDNYLLIQINKYK